MPLTQEEIDGCRDAFLAFDKDRSGTIDVWELRQVLEGAHAAALPYGALCGCGRASKAPASVDQGTCALTRRRHVACAPRRLALCARAAMGQKPTEEELFQMISEVDDNMSGSIGP